MADLAPVFARLRALLADDPTPLAVVTDEPEHFYANTTQTDAKGRPVFWGSVKVSKTKVLFHLMPVYCYPELLDDASPTLKKRMQGKSCFNFTKVDEALFAELATLVIQSRGRYRSEGQM